MSTPTTPYGVGMTQDDMMKKDQVILLDAQDNMIGNASKVDSHTFSTAQARGMLHRAFSVFLFDDQGRLLLQQRAASKITFPNVWTNTCCSHPLHGYTPSEVDTAEMTASGQVSGVISAAIRKLEHELGIAINTIPAASFKYLTRLHYWAADVVTHGKQSQWGEHEIDYILFVQMPPGQNVKLHPNNEEVSGTAYVTRCQLIEQMKPSSGLLWSPWFRIIAEKFLLPHWWKDLNITMNTNTFVDLVNIHKFDPTGEHMGGAGNAGVYLGIAQDPYSDVTASAYAATVGNAAVKQGSYGKVRIHSHGKLDQILRIDEIFAALCLKTIDTIPNKVRNLDDTDTRFCDDMLGKVSRSFAAVIRQLPSKLCLDILIFYLALRALDTIEDDMEAFVGRESVKLYEITNFYRIGLVTDGWSMSGVGKAHEAVLLEQYYRCVSVYKKLSQPSQEVIADITKRMGKGMADFAGIDLGQGTVTTADYDLYCHYVAGLVGEGLSRLFTVSGYEGPQVAACATTSANTMGLFLQKTNIIRDYLEDYVDGRAFWPQDVWKMYSKTDNLGEFAKAEALPQALSCLNHLVTNALQCIPEVLEYMKLLHTEEVFRFCAIPQVMAIATLAELYNNPKVFTGVVKIRKCQAAQLILDTKTMDGLHKWFNILTNQIANKVIKSDPNAKETIEICNKVLELTNSRAKRAKYHGYAKFGNIIACSMVFVSTWQLAFGSASGNSVNRSTRTWTHVLGGSCAYILGYGVLTNTRERLVRAD